MRIQEAKGDSNLSMRIQQVSMAIPILWGFNKCQGPANLRMCSESVYTEPSAVAMAGVVPCSAGCGRL